MCGTFQNTQHPLSVGGRLFQPPFRSFNCAKSSRWSVRAVGRGREGGRAIFISKIEPNGGCQDRAGCVCTRVGWGGGLGPFLMRIHKSPRCRKRVPNVFHRPPSLQVHICAHYGCRRPATGPRQNVECRHPRPPTPRSHRLSCELSADLDAGKAAATPHCHSIHYNTHLCAPHHPDF